MDTTLQPSRTRDEFAPPVVVSARPVGLGGATAILAAVLAVLAFMTWTASSSNDRFFTRAAPETDYYAMLARGFRSGHLNMQCDIPPALLKVRDPYDPEQRGELGMHDATFYQGKYYLYFGAAPVVLLELPFEVLTGKDLQLAWQTLLFSAGGYLVLAAVLIAVWRRYFARVGATPVVGGLLALGLCTMVPSALRRSHIWEMPIAAGFCFAAAAFGATYAALHRRRQTLWFTMAGLLLGLAIASRAVYVAGTVLPATALVWLWWAGHSEKRWNIWPDRTWWAPAMGCGAALGAIVALLLAYNYLRFGNPFEFGMKYQLTSVYEGKVRHFSLTYWSHNLRLYFANMAHWSRTYPYVLPGDPPAPTPKGYLYAECVTAVFPNLPFYGLALFAPLAVWRARSQPLTGWLAAVSAFAVAMSALLMCFVSTADRYMVDFLPAWALIASVGLLGLETVLAERRWIRWSVRAVWIFTAAISVFVAVIVSIEAHGTFADAKPAQYRRVVQFFTSPMQWFATRNDDPTLLLLPRGGMIRSWGAELDFKCNAPAWKNRCFPLLVAGRPQVADTIVLVVTETGRLQLGFDHWGDGRVLSPEFDASPELNLRLEYGALDESRPHDPRRWLTAYCDGRQVWHALVHFNSGLLDRVRFGENRIEATTCEKILPTEVHARLISPRL